MTELEKFELQLKRVSELKEIVIKCQDFEFAAALRVKEIALTYRIKMMKEHDEKKF